MLSKSPSSRADQLVQMALLSLLPAGRRARRAALVLRHIARRPMRYFARRSAYGDGASARVV